jgi:hypothetical protein
MRDHLFFFKGTVKVHYHSIPGFFIYNPYEQRIGCFYVPSFIATIILLLRRTLRRLVILLNRVGCQLGTTFGFKTTDGNPSMLAH